MFRPICMQPSTTLSPHWTGNAARRHIIPSATVASNASETVGLLYLFATLLMMLLDPLGAGTVRCHCRFTQQCLDPGSRLARSPTSTRSILRRQARKIQSKVHLEFWARVNAYASLLVYCTGAKQEKADLVKLLERYTVLKVLPSKNLRNDAGVCPVMGSVQSDFRAGDLREVKRAASLLRCACRHWV